MKRVIYFLAMVVFAAFAAQAESAAQLFQKAKNLDDSNEFAKALALYLKADSAYVAEGLASTAEYVQSLHSTGRAYLNTNNLAKGREYTLKAAQLREKLFGKVSKDYITSLNNYALSYLIANELQDALKYQTEVIDLCNQMTPPHPDEGMYLINLGRIYHALGNDDKAIEYMEEALPKVEKFSSNYEYILTFLGKVYMDKNDNVNTYRIMGLVDEHNTNELKKECTTPECHIERAEYYINTGNQAKAKDEFMEAFAMPLTAAQRITAYTKYAVFLTNLNDFAQAGEYYAMAAEATINQSGYTEEATALLHHAGLCYFVGKEYDKAIEMYENVITTVDKHNYSKELKNSSLMGLGNAYIAKEEYYKAAEMFRSWIKYLEDSDQIKSEDYAKAYERLATAEKFGGDYKNSIAHYEKAIELYGNLGMLDEQEQVKASLTLCKFYAKEKLGETTDNSAAQKQREQKIKDSLIESINTLAQGGDYLGKLSTAQTLAGIAGRYALLKDYDNAILYYSRYIPAIREAIAEDFLLKNPKERELTWSPELVNFAEMNEMLTELPMDPELYGKLSNLLYEGQLLTKGILLSSNVEFEKNLNRYATKEMRDKYAEIKRNLEQISAMKQRHEPKEQILELTRKTDSLQLSLSRDNAQFADFMNYLRVTSQDIVKSLPSDAIAIEFLTLDTDLLDDDDIIVAVALSQEYPQGISLPVATVKDIKNIIADKDKFTKNDYGNAVWGRILETFPNKHKIYFAPDGILNNIGIEYLSVNGKPISEQLEISRLSSTREIARTHKLHPLQYASLFGAIDYAGDGEPASDKRKYALRRSSEEGLNFSALANTEREVQEINAILKNHAKKTFPYTATKASKAEFLSQQEIPVSILHIATHGKFIEGNSSDIDAMSRSILVFAGANMFDNYTDNVGVVTAAEIADMSLHNCNLAVLSACESGLGKLGTDGVFGLQRGFKNAGVSTLLVSLNEVADNATADMMISFYRNLFANEGTTMQEAFRKAQTEIRTKYPNDDTWASFILIDSFN